ncbi:hypothetical protein TWF481_004068 [Arthrobotrys musiformis]|uniref:Peptidase S8/S53 domain-containing protein n=1 Tax=Arthrobotrys musiformis TaxID=47236 RepID=A0AAV9WKH8_9PEZI
MSSFVSHWAGPKPPGEGGAGPPRELFPPIGSSRLTEKRHALKAPNLSGGYALLESRAIGFSEDTGATNDGSGRKLFRFATSLSEMSIISQPPGVWPEEIGPTRFQWGNAGKGVKVYVIDSGCDPSHKYKAFDFQRRKLLARDSTSWIYSGPLPSDEKSDDDIPNFVGKIPKELAGGHLPAYHGTMTAGRIVGFGYGLAPFADLVVVKLQSGRNYGIGEWGLLDPLLKIYDDIQRFIKKDKRKIKGFVISASISITPSPGLETKLPSWYRTIARIYRELLREFENIEPKVYYATSAGNNKPGTPINNFPASIIIKERGRAKGAFKQCVIVGGVRYDGTTIFQDGPNVDLYAPADRLPMPIPLMDPKRPKLSRSITMFGSGTSFSTPLVAGLLAELISSGHREPVTLMKKWAYPRTKGGHDVIWNGVKKSYWDSAAYVDSLGVIYPPKRPNKKHARPPDDGPGDDERSEEGNHSGELKYSTHEDGIDNITDHLTHARPAISQHTAATNNQPPLQYKLPSPDISDNIRTLHRWITNRKNLKAENSGPKLSNVTKNPLSGRPSVKNGLFPLQTRAFAIPVLSFRRSAFRLRWSPISVLFSSSDDHRHLQ